MSFSGSCLALVRNGLSLEGQLRWLCRVSLRGLGPSPGPCTRPGQAAPLGRNVFETFQVKSVFSQPCAHNRSCRVLRVHDSCGVFEFAPHMMLTTPRPTIYEIMRFPLTDDPSRPRSAENCLPQVTLLGQSLSLPSVFADPRGQAVGMGRAWS